MAAAAAAAAAAAGGAGPGHAGARPHARGAPGGPRARARACAGAYYSHPPPFFLIDTRAHTEGPPSLSPLPPVPPSLARLLPLLCGGETHAFVHGDFVNEDALIFLVPASNHFMFGRRS